MGERLAFVFPGQGSQYVGMGKSLQEISPRAREMFSLANQTLGLDLRALCMEGPEEALRLTENTQPAILLVSAMAAGLLRERGITPVIAAGHSLGEYSALVAAGALSLEDALVLVRKRGQFMREATPPGMGAMAALIGLSVEAVEEICFKARDGEVLQPANLNGADQVVIAGHAGAVERAIRLAKEAGAARAVLLQVSAPFHCALMEPAAQRLAVELDRIPLGNLAFPVVANVSARPMTTGAEARSALKAQVCAPVRWLETMDTILGQEVERIVEVGPGRVLSGLFKRHHRHLKVANVEDAASLERALEGLP